MNSTKPEHVQIADMFANVHPGPVGRHVGGRHAAGGHGHRGLGKGSGKTGRKPAGRSGWDWTMDSLNAISS
jgi:hypothetical protein